MAALLHTGVTRPPGQALAEMGWDAVETTAEQVAASYGRDLADPFSADPISSRRAAAPPWLDTAFVRAERTSPDGTQPLGQPRPDIG